MRPAAKAAAHTAAMLAAWHQAGIARADLAVRTANAAMLWYADRPLDDLPLALARAHNVKQADIYIRPARGHAWPMVLLDDVDIAMAQRVAKHYATLVVHTSAQGGCHLWLRLTRALDEAQRRQVQRWLIPKVDADPGSVSGEHLGRLAGMKNFKRAGQWVNVLQQPRPHTRPWDPTPALQAAPASAAARPTPCTPAAPPASMPPPPRANGAGSAARSKPVCHPRPSTNVCSRMPHHVADATPSATPAIPSPARSGIPPPGADSPALSPLGGAAWFTIRLSLRLPFTRSATPQPAAPVPRISCTSVLQRA
jgi:hypothetical protein